MLAALTEMRHGDGLVRGRFGRFVERIVAPNGLRSHLAAMVMLALVPPILALCVGGYKVVQDTHERRLQDWADAGAAVIDREIASVQQVAATMSRPELLDPHCDPAILETLIGAFSASLGMDLVVWHGDPAIIIAGDVTARRRFDAALEANYVRAAQLGPEVVSVSWPDSRDVVLFASSARSKVVVEAFATRAQLMRMLRVPSGLPGARASLTMADADAAGSADSGRPAAAPVNYRNRLSMSLYGVPASDEIDEATMTAYAASSRSPDLRVTISQFESNVRGELKGPLAVIGRLAALSLLVAACSALWIGGWLAKPLRRLSVAARAVATGVESRAQHTPSPVIEIEELRRSIAAAYEMSRRRAAAERMALDEAKTGHELLASVINGTADPIDVKDLELELVLLNRAALRGDPKRGEWQFLGRREEEFLPSDEARRSARADREVIATGESRSSQMERTRADGSRLTFAVTKTPWLDVAGRIAGVVTVMHDISAHRAAEERLASVQAELIRATRLSTMGAMAAGLAHELNQPLAAAINFLNAANRLLVGDPPDPFLLAQARSAVTDAREQALRTGGIVRRLRDFVGRGETELKIERVNELIHDIVRVATAGGEVSARTIVIREGAKDLRALVDGTQIQQVLLNLIRNASEALGDARNAMIELSWRTTVDGIEITVADNGPGLSPTMRGRLFEPFASSKALGMGIGLTICRTIVEGHGGALTAEDNPRGGALFRISLPPVLSQTDIEKERQPCT